MSQKLFGLQASERPLLGKVCAIPRLNGRGRWWTTITDQSPCGKFIRVKLGGGQGRSRWVAVKDAMEIRDGRK
ncbi:MAG TPA: hypothetical protein VNP98_17170 [Chthoniobacterales bacterium]|nr:hypothetical protein [Chthoniobacterales bacterium]